MLEAFRHPSLQIVSAEKGSCAHLFLRLIGEKSCVRMCGMCRFLKYCRSEKICTPNTHNYKFPLVAYTLFIH